MQRPLPAPRLGQHTDAVLAELLGYDAHHIGQLRDQGIIGAVVG